MGAPLAIDAGFKTALATITGLRADDTWPDTILPPHAWPKLQSDEGDITLGGLDAVWIYDLHLAVAKAGGLRKAMAALLPYLAKSGAQSVRAALYADDSLGGVADGIRNFRLSAVGEIEFGTVRYVGAVWRVEVMAS